MDLCLDTTEAQLLARVLRHRLEELRREIHHTDRAAFKAAMKADETVLEGLLERLKLPAEMGI